MQNTATLVSHWVLVDPDHILILQNGLIFWTDGTQVVGHDKRRG